MVMDALTVSHHHTQQLHVCQHSCCFLLSSMLPKNHVVIESSLTSLIRAMMCLQSTYMALKQLVAAHVGASGGFRPRVAWVDEAGSNLNFLTDPFTTALIQVSSLFTCCSVHGAVGLGNA